MTASEDMMRQAYIDGQLSVEEVIQFEEKLTKEEKKIIDAEKRLDGAIVNTLSQGSDCPDALWADLKSQLQAEATIERPDFSDSRSRWQQFRLIGIAAAVAVILTVVTFWQSPYVAPGPADPQYVYHVEFPHDFSSFVQGAKHVDVADAQAQLASAGFPITLKPPTEHHGQPMDFHGIKLVQHNGRQMAQLYYSCCGEPVAVVLVPAELTEVVDNIRTKGLDREYRQVQRAVSDTGYHMVAVGAHSTSEIMDTIQTHRF